MEPKLVADSRHHGEMTLSIEFDGRVLFRARFQGELIGEHPEPKKAY